MLNSVKSNPAPNALEKLRVAVAICTKGRPAQLAETLQLLNRQTYTPCQVLVVATGPMDIPDNVEERSSADLDIVFSPEGLTSQRNVALERLLKSCDVIFFMDDDYLAEKHAVQAIAEAFALHADVAGVTGHLLADGIHTGGISCAQAKRLITQFEKSAQKPATTIEDRRCNGLYGCNMAFRTSSIGTERFDEALPKYGWQEDVDFSNRVDGKIIRIGSLVGVHCGTPLGRERFGVALGYSQIANPLYLMRKGTMRRNHAARLILRNFAANLVRLVWCERWVRRTGRITGNIWALWELATGKIHPQRIVANLEQNE